jgi:hypothetical protein
MIDDHVFYLADAYRRLALDFERINSANVSSKEGMEAITSLKTDLFAHLRYEDEKLFPYLEHTAKGDPRVIKSIEPLKAIEEIKPRLTEKFDEYASGGDVAETQGREFFKELCRLFIKRFEREGEVLSRL